MASPPSSVVSAGGSSSTSATSQFRHLKFAPSSTTPSSPTRHEGGGGGVGVGARKSGTSCQVGIMVVGLGGANGTTMLAGITANRLGIKWKGPKGEDMTCNYNGCITQLPPRGIHGGVGYQGMVIPSSNGTKNGGGSDDGTTPQQQEQQRLNLANVNNAAVGGWDIRPEKPGDALLQQQILDYDLVRQIQSEMNSSCKIFRGLYDPRFIGSSQHATATHILTTDDAKNDREALRCLRADIRYFKWRYNITGHTTVIWSASVEPNSDYVTQLSTAQQLLDSINLTEDERGAPLPPSLLYATAAVLEGCSFVNGGSQNTLGCPGLWELSKQQLGVYCLGTDFKAGQTKFKTAAVEYLRTMGLTPRVIASSNHLGNNDMKNISTAKAVTTAKLRVKHDIFAPWQEDQLDHKVSIMYTPYINDDKRDFVEYTSFGFLGQPHTMVTYTRASDSVLCVPLMIDAAVWCDYFSYRQWPYEKVSKALAYLFKVPEGGAKGVDPGFFRQMEELKAQVFAAFESNDVLGSSASKDLGIRSPTTNLPDSTWCIPLNAKIACAGLACVDMQLNQATGGDGGEGIETFQGETSIGGGSVSMACKTLGRLSHGESVTSGESQTTPPVVSSVTPLCMIGNDDTGTKLLSLLERCGTTCHNIDTHIIRNARTKHPSIRTALSVLPIFKDGRRGCFFDAASNTHFSTDQLMEMISELPRASYGALLFGYPHLLPLMQGEALGQFFSNVRKSMIDNGIVALDLNGVSDSPIVKAGTLRALTDLQNDRVIGPALEHVDILHMNEDELILLTGTTAEDNFSLAKAVDLFLECGVAVVAVTRGRDGSYVACSSPDRFARSPALPSSWANCSVHVPAADLPTGDGINTNGAGDAYTAGLLVASMLRHSSSSPSERPTGDGVATGTTTTGSTKMTPYTLYVRENYVTLKQQYQGDKVEIFNRCHVMWENETDDVKAMYARMVVEEFNSDDSAFGGGTAKSSSTNVMSDTKMEGTIRKGQNTSSLNLESAVQLAGLVAAYHVDTGTRNLDHLDLSMLLERSIMPSSSAS